MKVKLRNNWFADGTRYKKGVQDIPDDLVKLLPKTAVLLDKPKAAEAQTDGEVKRGPGRPKADQQ